MNNICSQSEDHKNCGIKQLVFVIFRELKQNWKKCFHLCPSFHCHCPVTHNFHLHSEPNQQFQLCMLFDSCITKNLQLSDAKPYFNPSSILIDSF